MKNFRIIDKEIYGGSSPSDKDLKYLKNILNINLIISLDAKEGNRIKDKLKDLNIKQSIIPLDSKTNLDQHLKYIINNFSNFIEMNQPVFIHCLHGQDRTSFVEAVYHIKKQNWNFKQTINKIKQFGYGNGVPQDTKNFWNNLLYALDQNADISMADDDYVLNSLRDTFRIDETGIPQGYQRGFLGPADVTPNTGLNTRKEQMEDLISNIGKIPSVGVNTGLGATRGFGPVEHSAICESI